MDKLKTTNGLLLILVIPVIFYLLKTLSFIFIPLVFSMFIALLFLPLMRWLKKRRVGKTVSILIVVGIMAGMVTIGVQLIKLSTNQIANADSDFIELAETKLIHLVQTIDQAVGLDLTEDKTLTQQLIEKTSVLKNVGPTLSFINSTLTMLLMTIFFSILWLTESINMERILHKVLLKKRYTSVKTFMKIERDLIKFVKVKFLISLATGVGTGLVCYFFGVSFPIFWGLF
ncbi:MAG TPA: AI-2E family transporter, partial [Chitinophagaceae bacterium]|nr:AI-2E family transporter [Chitinophagaceae bacterium]